MSDEDNDDEPYEIRSRLGEMTVRVSGPDPEQVRELHDEMMDEMLGITEQSYSALLNADGYE